MVIGVAVILAVLALVVRNQVKVHRNREARAALLRERHPVVPEPLAVTHRRQTLFDLLRPVALTNCRLERFGEAHDGGYLMCGNLLDAVRSGYSYGIGGYDKWGCDISTRLDVAVHQYDCFNTTQPSCLRGETVFHAECVAGTPARIEGRLFDTMSSHLAKNGDSAARIVLKIDVEGAEWDTLLSLPDATLQQIDQLAVEFHWIEDEQFDWVHDEKYLRVVDRLRHFFHVVHIHFNNASCVGDLSPFPTWAYEVLFVSKRLGVVDPSRTVTRPHPLDAPNNPSLKDCQPASR